MNNGNSLLVGLLLGALAGAAASYWLLKDKNKFTQELEDLAKKVKASGVHNTPEPADTQPHT